MWSSGRRFDTVLTPKNKKIKYIKVVDILKNFYYICLSSLKGIIAPLDKLVKSSPFHGEDYEFESRTEYLTAPKALLAMHMTCNHDNLVRFRVGAQHYRSFTYCIT